MSNAGTESPPLEATGENVPMGASSVEGGPVSAVPDTEQRKDYVQDKSSKGTSSESGSGKKGEAKPQKLGQSLQDTLESRT